jgi:hypothetical protein
MNKNNSSELNEVECFLSLSSAVVGIFFLVGFSLSLKQLFDVLSSVTWWHGGPLYTPSLAQ